MIVWYTYGVPHYSDYKMTNAYGLTTADRVKAKLSITVTDWDVVLKQYIYSVTDFLENVCGRRFQQTTYTNEVYDGSNIDGSPKAWLVLRNSPVTTLTSFQYRTGAKSSPTWVDYQADTYQERLSLGIIRVNLARGFQNNRVTYTAGYLIDFTAEYDTTHHTLPYDLSGLAESLVTRMFKKRESEGRSQEAFNNSSITWGDLLGPEDKTIIANYSRTELV